MSDLALAAIDRVIAALTDDSLERTDVDDQGVTVITVGEAIPLLQRSVSNELDRVASVSFRHTRLLRAIGISVDEALLAATEAKLLLQGGQA
ncbi:MAG: hypothetical protein U9R07_15715 [Pseudomonadota bacterium]|nr:hypothetical protein [Pseudomonadota bacterium]